MVMVVQGVKAWILSLSICNGNMAQSRSSPTRVIYLEIVERRIRALLSSEAFGRTTSAAESVLSEVRLPWVLKNNCHHPSK